MNVYDSYLGYNDFCDILMWIVISGEMLKMFWKFILSLGIEKSFFLYM